MSRQKVAVFIALVALASSCYARASTSETSRQTEKAEPAQAEEAATPTKEKPLPSSASSVDPALAKIDDFIKERTEAGNIDKSKSSWRTRMPFPPELAFDKTKNYFWNLRTSKGDIKIRFMPDVAPMHVSSSIYLIRSGFYNDLLFHRVITNFMAQGGCPTGNGKGSPGYKYDGETSSDVKHDRPGLLSMANRGPGTDGSQFFLTFVPTGWLDGKHTIFGEVVEGMNVVKALEAEGSGNGKTETQIKMVESTVTVEPKAKKKKAKGN